MSREQTNGDQLIDEQLDAISGGVMAPIDSDYATTTTTTTSTSTSTSTSGGTTVLSSKDSLSGKTTTSTTSTTTSPTTIASPLRAATS